MCRSDERGSACLGLPPLSACGRNMLDMVLMHPSVCCFASGLGLPDRRTLPSLPFGDMEALDVKKLKVRSGCQACDACIRWKTPGLHRLRPYRSTSSAMSWLSVALTPRA